MERESLKPSEFYWGIGLLLSVLMLDIYYSSGELFRHWIYAFLFFILSMIPVCNKKIINKFDYKQKGGKK